MRPHPESAIAEKLAHEREGRAGSYLENCRVVVSPSDNVDALLRQPLVVFLEYALWVVLRERAPPDMNVIHEGIPHLFVSSKEGAPYPDFTGEEMGEFVSFLFTYGHGVPVRWVLCLF